MADELITSQIIDGSRIFLFGCMKPQHSYTIFVFVLESRMDEFLGQKVRLAAEPRQAARSVCNVLHAVLASGMRVIPQYD